MEVEACQEIERSQAVGSACLVQYLVIDGLLRTERGKLEMLAENEARQLQWPVGMEATELDWDAEAEESVIGLEVERVAAALETPGLVLVERRKQHPATVA